MSSTARRGRITLRQGDITTDATADALVNAADPSLLGGRGVDGAIHRAAGPALLAECRPLGGCPTGEARITGAGLLRARHVIHTVGPVWRGGGHDEARLLASCYLDSLRLAADASCSVVAAPAVSCGAYGYPHKEAAHVAVTAVAEALEVHRTIREVRFWLSSAVLLAVFERALEAAGER